MLTNSSQSNWNLSILMFFGLQMPSNILKRNFRSALKLGLLILIINQSTGSDLRLRKKFRFSSCMEATKAKQPNTNQYKPGFQTYGFHNKLSVFWIFPLISNLHNSRLRAKLQGQWTNYFFNSTYLHCVIVCFIQHLGLQLPH